MGNKKINDPVEGIFIIHSNKEKREREKIKLPESIIEEEIYYPTSLYVLRKGFGGKYKGKTMEWVFNKHPDVFFEMFFWSKYGKNRPPDNSIFSLRINWLIKAFQLCPRCRCATYDCSKESKYFSTRQSKSSAYSFGPSSIACEDHKDSLDSFGEGNIKIHPLIFESHHFFESKEYKKSFFVFLRNCFLFKSFGEDNFFTTLKFYLPDMKIKVEQTLEEKKVIPKNNLTSSQLELF